MKILMIDNIPLSSQIDTSQLHAKIYTLCAIYLNTIKNYLHLNKLESILLNVI